MGITKTDGFSDQINDMSDALKALGHPARLAIIQFLSESSSCICNDIVGELPLAQPTISRHLSELKRVGLIKGNIEGKNICYCINEERWKEVQVFMEEITIKMARKNSCC